MTSLEQVNISTALAFGLDTYTKTSSWSVHPKLFSPIKVYVVDIDGDATGKGQLLQDKELDGIQLYPAKPLIPARVVLPSGTKLLHPIQHLP